jgi:hypothetical protein
MRRVTITLGIVAILVSSCGRSDPTASFETRLEEQAAAIRDLAEEGKPGLARDRLENLVASVTSRLDRGLIEEGWALEILESAEVVELQLRLLPASAESEAPSPSPVQEEEEEGNGGEGSGDGKDEGEGNGKDEGNGKGNGKND